jgi:alpha-N-acetylglucosaminidase
MGVVLNFDRRCAPQRILGRAERNAMCIRTRLVSVIAGVALTMGTATPGGAADLAPARAVLQRLLHGHADQFQLGLLPPDGQGEHFLIKTHNSRIEVRGSTPSAVLFGVNWYLKYVAHVSITTNGDRIVPGRWPLPARPIEGRARFKARYALNENTDGYSSAYWDWKRWEREIDVLALSGVNTVLIERGSDAVLYKTFTDLGLSDTAVRAWIAAPAHQNWQLMGNLCCFDGPISRELMDRRLQSARRILERLRALGIEPVLPGYYGVVPADLSRLYPEIHVVRQGKWAGFDRPDWLDPRDPLFARIADRFYSNQQQLLGSSRIYDMEVFQEGGASGDVPVADAARKIQEALHAAHAGAGWMMLAWEGNPRQELLSGVDRRRLFIIDIDHTREPREDRKTDFGEAPYLFGGIWEFGGRNTFGANLGEINERLTAAARSNPNLIGTALFTEGLDTNPFAFDFFTEAAWRETPVDLTHWATDYAQRRYGGADPHAAAAWNVMLTTAYDIRVNDAPFNSERNAGQDSLFDAEPSLTTNRASHWSPEGMRYPPEQFRQALAELLRVAPALRVSEGYEFDLTDVARQVLANESRLLLPRIDAAYRAKDDRQFDDLTARWLQLMSLQDRLLATNRHFLLGPWLNAARRWGVGKAEQARLEHDQRSLITTWGTRAASAGAHLQDYGNKDLAGLMADYYRARWAAYFAALSRELHTGQAAAPIDWYAFGERWNQAHNSYRDQPHGDTYAVATETLRLTAP